jgi:hypothetical protein
MPRTMTIPLLVHFFSMIPAVITFSDPAIDSMSCYQILFAAYVTGSIADETCQLVQEEVRETCCSWNNSTPVVEYRKCAVCGDGGIAFQDANITRPQGEGDNVSCSFVGEYASKGYFDANQCEYFKSIAGPCCAASNQTSVPVEGTTVASTSTTTTPDFLTLTRGLMLMGASFMVAALN